MVDGQPVQRIEVPFDAGRVSQLSSAGSWDPSTIVFSRRFNWPHADQPDRVIEIHCRASHELSEVRFNGHSVELTTSNEEASWFASRIAVSERIGKHNELSLVVELDHETRDSFRLDEVLLVIFE